MIRQRVLAGFLLLIFILISHYLYTEDNLKLVGLIESSATQEFINVFNKLKPSPDFSVDQIDIYGNTLLYHACKEGQQEMVEFLLKQGASLDEKNIWGTSPLHVAAMFGRTQIIKILLESGARVDIRNVPEATPLHLAVEKNYPEIVLLLLAGGADINSKDNELSTALHKACLAGNMEMVKLLLSKKALLNEENIFKKTPLFLAAENGHEQIALLLAQAGADLNINDEYGYSVFQLACIHGLESLARFIVEKSSAKQELLAQKFESCLDWYHDYEGYTPLHLASANGRKNIVSFLLERGADMQARTANDHSAFYLAVQGGYQEIVNIFRSRGIDLKKENENQDIFFAAAYGGIKWLVDYYLNNKGNPDALSRGNDYYNDYNDKSLLELAAGQGHLDIIKLLAEHGAAVSPETDGGNTALFRAVRNGHTSVVQYLLSKGKIDINKENDYGFSLLHISAREGHTEIVDLLLKAGAEINLKTGKYTDEQTPLHLACLNRHSDTARLLVQAGADLHARDRDGLSILHAACLGGITWLAQELITRGVEINEQYSGYYEKGSALHLATQQGHTEIIKLLLANKADINGKNDDGETPLHVAAREGQLAAAELLLKNKAGLEIKDKYGETALFKAVEWNSQSALAQFLILQGASIYAKSNSGSTLLEEAAEAGLTEVAELIIKEDKEGLLIKNKAVLLNALHRACFHGRIAMVRLLINMGADVNGIINGESPLYTALYWEYQEIARVLIEAGADVNFKVPHQDDDNWYEGRSVLHESIENGFEELARLLIQKGADIRAKDKEGCSVFHLACSKGYT
jgi:ankyrin repeat protein